MDIAKSEFGMFWSKGDLGDEQLLSLLLSGERKFGPILLRLLAEVSKKRGGQRIVIVLDALDEISRRVEESKDAVESNAFIDGADSLMLNLLKPISNESFNGMSVSVIFSCLKPVQPDQSFGRTFAYVDCEKAALTDADKGKILDSWKHRWIEDMNAVDASEPRCDASTPWLSQVMDPLSRVCFHHGDLRVSLLLVGFVLQEAFFVADARDITCRRNPLSSSIMQELQLTLELLCSKDMSVQIVSYIAQSILCCRLKNDDEWEAAVAKSLDALALVAYSGQESQTRLDARHLRFLFPDVSGTLLEQHLHHTVRPLLVLQPREPSKINFNPVLLDVVRRHMKDDGMSPLNAYTQKLHKNEKRLSKDQQRRMKTVAFREACSVVASRQDLILRAQRVLSPDFGAQVDVVGTAGDLMHVLRIALAFQSPCCAVDAFVSTINLKETINVSDPQVLGDLCLLLAFACSEADGAPSDFKPLRLHGLDAACRKVVTAFDSAVFVYGWTLQWKPSVKQHLISVLVLLQQLNEIDLMDRIIADAFQQLMTTKPAQVILWNQLINSIVRRTSSTKMAASMMDRMLSQGCEPDVVTWSTLMNAHAGKGDAAACERVMRDMRAAGQEPDVTTWSTLMNAHQKAKCGEDVLRTFQDMRKAGCSFDAHTLSSLFNGLMFGIRGDRRAGALRVVELYPSLVTPSNLNHFVSTPIMRALADVAAAADVDRFWSFCEQHLRSSRQGWPGQATATVLANCCSRCGDRGAWPRVAALLSSAGVGSGGDAGSRGAATPRVFCKNWQAAGSCRFGDRCNFKDGHK